jgi:hypothetical protein
MTNINVASDGQLDTAISDGESARALLQNTALVKALHEIEAKATEAMIEAQNSDEREAKWYITRAIRELKKQLLTTANAGTAAKDTKAKRVKNGQK